MHQVLKRVEVVVSVECHPLKRKKSLDGSRSICIFLHFTFSKSDSSVIFSCKDFTALLRSGPSSVFASR